MTLGSLMNWGGLGKGPSAPPIERYHSGSGGYWEHKSHGHGGWKSGGGKGGGGSGTALSALTLLAFLFLLNVMQQSLQENNATVATTATTALLLREGQQQISLNGRAGTDETKNSGKRDKSSPEARSSRKGDVFSANYHDRVNQ